MSAPINPRAVIWPSSSNHSLTFRPGAGASPSAKTNVSIRRRNVLGGLSRRLADLSGVGRRWAHFSAARPQHLADRSDRLHGRRLPRAAVRRGGGLFLKLI